MEIAVTSILYIRARSFYQHLWNLITFAIRTIRISLTGLWNAELEQTIQLFVRSKVVVASPVWTSSKTTGSIIGTWCGDLPRRQEQWKWERAQGRNARAAGRRRAARGAFPVPRRGMPARATKPTRRHSPRAGEPLAVLSPTRNFSWLRLSPKNRLRSGKDSIFDCRELVLAFHALE